ncbi:hypothetical protein PG993_014061 [Apiospora rasikravindrae]|uniref:Cell wall protein n=1 Tax=Apiospora rasikravindrae TaxID=990691 RepID=A0ABR1RTH5_9PEZI
MRASTLFSVVAMATGTIATFGDSAPPTKTPKEDASSVSDLVTSVSSAMSQLDTSIKAFDGGDGSKVKTDTEHLVSTIKECASSLKESGKEITLKEISGLQPLMSGINTIGQGLASDFEKKKTQFEQSELCTDIQGGLQSIGKETKKLMEGVVGNCPQEAKTAASSLGEGVVTTLTKGGDLFKSFHCMPPPPNGGSKHNTPPAASSSAAASASVPATPPKQSAVAPPPAAAPVTVTATVTAPCACSSSAMAPPPPPAVPTTKSSAAPYPTGPSKTTVAGSTGGVKPTSTGGVPVVTAAAVPNAMAPIGVVAGLFALML